MSRRQPGVPAGARVYAVGDIHGRADLLEELHRLMLADAKRRRARTVVVYLGDYVDRGPRSRDVIDLLLAQPLPGFEAVHLRGNHEDMMLGFLDDPSLAEMWCHNGGAATMQSYGVDAQRLGGAEEAPLIDLQRDFARRLPQAHRAFLEDLAPSHREGDYFFVHAGVRPGVPLDRQNLADMLWIRDPFLDSRRDHGKVVVHGHSIVARPEVRKNRIGIDTGAFYSGRLTCLVLEGAKRKFLHTG